MLAQLHEDYPDDVRIVYRHFPLTEIHDKAQLAAEATEAAGVQGQFWPMHDLLFARFGEWNSLSPDQFRQLLDDYAAEIGLDLPQFIADLDNGTFTAKVLTARETAIALSLRGTPVVVVNGAYYNDLPYDYFTLNAIIQLELLRERQFAEAPPLVIDPTANYIALLELETGTVVLDLFAEQAPTTVNSFAFLACQGW